MYLIEAVESKDKETYNRWHSKCIGKRCLIELHGEGSSLRMMIEGLLGDPEKWNGYRTSKILRITDWEDYSGIIRLCVETQNSIYTLRRLPDDSI